MIRRTPRKLAVALATTAVAASALVAAAPAAAANGTIAGTVTAETGGAPIESIAVLAYTASGDYVTETSTDAAGEYELFVAPGDYLVKFSTVAVGAYVPEWWGDSLFESGAASLTVADGAETVADAELETGSTITGSITTVPGQTGAEVLNMNSYAWDSVAGEWFPLGGGFAVSYAETVPYTIYGLSTKVDYRIRYSVTCSAYCVPLVPEWYDDAPTIASADDVAAGSTGIDVTLVPTPTVRIAGEDRFETSALISEEYDAAEVETVYVSNGLNFPDALGAAPAAVVNGAPLLLTAPDFLPESVADALETLDPARVVITGSEASVSADVEDAIAELLPSAEIDRFGGADRFETSRLIIEDAFPTGSTEAWVATGFIFADALSAAPVAGKHGAPVILVNGPLGTLDAETAQLIEDLGVTQINIAGGTPSVSAGLAAAIDALPGVRVTRYSGADRYDTSRAINAIDSARDGTVYLATGVTFADALSGAALAGAQGAPLYLSPGPCVTPGVRAGIVALTPSVITVLGGPTTITPAAANLTGC